MTTPTQTQVIAGGVTVGGAWGDPRDEDEDDTAPSGQEARA